MPKLGRTSRLRFMGISESYLSRRYDRMARSTPYTKAAAPMNKPATSNISRMVAKFTSVASEPEILSPL